MNRKESEIREETNVDSFHVCYGQESKNVHMQLVPFDSNNHALRISKWTDLWE